MGFTLRKITHRDVDTVCAFIGSHVAEDGIAANKYFKEFLDRVDSGECRERNFVAEDDSGIPIGVCGFAPDKYATEGVFWLTWFYVDKAHIGSTVGRALFEHVRSALGSLGCRLLCLDTCNAKEYERALRFYGAAGFSLDGEIKGYYGPGQNMVFMSLPMVD